MKEKNRRKWQKIEIWNERKEMLGRERRKEKNKKRKIKGDTKKDERNNK